jgi:hypothetical protein
MSSNAEAYGSSQMIMQKLLGSSLGVHWVLGSEGHILSRSTKLYGFREIDGAWVHSVEISAACVKQALMFFSDTTTTTPKLSKFLFVVQDQPQTSLRFSKLHRRQKGCSIHRFDGFYESLLVVSVDASDDGSLNVSTHTKNVPHDPFPEETLNAETIDHITYLPTANKTCWWTQIQSQLVCFESTSSLLK